MSRKYRHQGYQDQDRDRDRDDRPGGDRPASSELTKEERIQRRSLRHAISREANEVIRCQVCGRNISNFGTVTTTSTCVHCSAPLHCCRTCTHFDSSARWQCRAQITEQVGDKTKANECASYEPRLVLDTTGRRSDTPQSNDPKSQFDNLFKR